MIYSIVIFLIVDSKLSLLKLLIFLMVVKCKDALANVKFVREKLLMDFMQEIAKDTNKYCFDYRDTIVWEKLDLLRIQIKHPTNNDKKKEICLTPKKAQHSNDFLKYGSTDLIWEIIQQDEFLEWLASQYKNYGCKLEFVTYIIIRILR
ncbi:hypothetical protein RFI_28544 [Reticulomyxa filosa]|uniref:Uncharacterized protein n=1 Tax=Reticulomyxa filosa TaxID=46433 RepID=X6M4C5_RETFI|nr:hypothetical protein RFI_28544 [Reticulomyxa filosa]|eukprot:ETO08843.1 hypothetical protein RFI_28544 [Reticulomyxa filosa]